MIAYGLEVYKHLLLQSEFLFSPFAEGVGFELQEAGCRLPVAVLSPDGFFESGSFQVAKICVQIQAFWRDENFEGVRLIRYTAFRCKRRRRRGDFRRQIGFFDHIPSGEDKGSLDGVFQLPDVPRPGIFEDAPHRLPAELLLPAVTAIMPVKKVFHEKGNVFNAFPQGGHGDVDDFEPVIEVFPEFSLGDEGS